MTCDVFVDTNVLVYDELAGVCAYEGLWITH